MADDLGGILEAILKKYGIKMPTPPAPPPAAPGLTPEDHKMLASFGAPAAPAPTPAATPEVPAAPNLAEVAKWNEIKGAIYEATTRGLGRWLSGPGDPRRLLNPFLPLSGPGPDQTYDPQRYRGVGAMGGRLRLIEDERSAPMRSLAAAAGQNPLIRGARVQVADLPGATGKISFRDPEHPEITLAPVLDPHSDPGLTAVHEALGHLGHGPVAWRAPDEMEMERRIRPQAEGTATGVERGVYGKLAPPSPYDIEYGGSREYQRSRALGESLAQHIVKTGHVPSPEAVQ